MYTLGIETSCDETAAAVVTDDGRILSNIIFSQVHLHKPYGGVVPEIASRSHVENLPAVLEEALAGAGLRWNQIDSVAFTYGPGLASSLLVGIAAAKGLSMRLGIPLVAINHMEAHIYSVFLGDNAPRIKDVCPFLSLVVSGGHTCLVRIEGIGRYTVLGQTGDDAAGEAFDKGANMLGLGYPGGPVIDRIAKEGNPGLIKFPKGRHKKERDSIVGYDPNLCFSFSGLKTALLYYLKDHPVSSDGGGNASVVASYQEAIVDALVERTQLALKDEQYVAAVGGVSLNSRLRTRLGQMAESRGVKLLLAGPRLCMDNAAMVAGLAAAGGGIRGEAAMLADADPSLELVE